MAFERGSRRGQSQLKVKVTGNTEVSNMRGLAAFTMALVMVVLVLGNLQPACAKSPAPVKREILALYDGARESADSSRIHRFAELPLNHLGFIVRFHDIRSKLPDLEGIERYRGVLTWFAGPVTDANAYLTWAARVAQLRLKYVILGDVGVDATPNNLFLLNTVMGAIGLRHAGVFVTPTIGTKINYHDKALLGFECHLDPVLPDYPIVEVVSPGVQPMLSLRTPSRDGGSISTLVAVSDKGAFAAFNYEFCHQRAPIHRGRWLVNPFEFFSSAFGREMSPIPDVTTVSGRRLFFSMVDSEGWSSETQFERFRQHHATNAEVVFRELIEPFSDLPVTVDIRETDVIASSRSAKQARAIMERVLALDHVERPGSIAIGTTQSRFDASYPSISSVVALRSVDNETVYYAATGDETAYSGDRLQQTSDLHALRETLRNTEVPRRLKGFNVNYHVYAGQQKASLQAVKDQLLTARSAALAPIAATVYGEIAAGFFTAKIDQVGRLSWRITHRGKLQTVRFDDASEVEVDQLGSVGVIGAKHHNGALYVALDEAVEAATVSLRTVGQSAAKEEEVMLIESRWRVRNFIHGWCYMSFEAQGFGSGEFSWANLGVESRLVTVVRGGNEVWRQKASVDKNGHLAFTIPADASQPLSVEIICDEQRRR